jgi:GT2 family glycosyltransferase
MNISIVILNWNGKKYLGTFLPKLITSSPEANIYVADNGSSDGSVRFLQQNYPEIKVIPFTENHGFAKGYNLALNQIEADYYILLNTDIEVTDNWIQPVISVMEQDESIAACQPKILSYDNRRHFEYAGAAGGFIDRYGYPFCRGRIFQVIEEDVGQYDDITEIFWASGACLFIKSNLFKKAGGFDNDFFAHMEEIDLCWRLKHLGYKIMYCGQNNCHLS